MGVPWLTNAFMLAMVSGTSFGALGVACLLLGGAQVLVSVLVSPILGSLTIVVLVLVRRLYLEEDKQEVLASGDAPPSPPPPVTEE